MKRNIAKTLLTQRNIDGGQLGKFINVLTASLFPFSVLSLIFSFGTLYSLELYKFLNLYEILIIATVCETVWLWLFFVYVYPSIHKGFNDQAYKFGNPIKQEFETLNNKVDTLTEIINNKNGWNL